MSTAAIVCKLASLAVALIFSPAPCVSARAYLDPGYFSKGQLKRHHSQLIFIIILYRKNAADFRILVIVETKATASTALSKLTYSM